MPSGPPPIAVISVAPVTLKVPLPSRSSVTSYQLPGVSHCTILKRPAPGKPGGTNATRPELERAGEAAAHAVGVGVEGGNPTEAVDVVASVARHADREDVGGEAVGPATDEQHVGIALREREPALVRRE